MYDREILQSVCLQTLSSFDGALSDATASMKIVRERKLVSSIWILTSRPPHSHLRTNHIKKILFKTPSHQFITKVPKSQVSLIHCYNIKNQRSIYPSMYINTWFGTYLYSVRTHHARTRPRPRARAHTHTHTHTH